MVTLRVTHILVGTLCNRRLRRITPQIRSAELYVDELLDACVKSDDVFSCSIAAVGRVRTASVEGKRRQDCERAQEGLDDSLGGTGE
jgi:hypothetical protein